MSGLLRATAVLRGVAELCRAVLRGLHRVAENLAVENNTAKKVVWSCLARPVGLFRLPRDFSLLRFLLIV